MKLLIHARDATADQIVHATAAAQAVFTAAGVSAYQCAAASFKQEAEDDDGLSADEIEQAALWWKAREVAHRACYAGRADAPRYVDFELIEGEAGLADVNAADSTSQAAV